jgi:photosystem II stability/assembly factor-like uncharacterized protein/PKD repeat protein
MSDHHTLLLPTVLLCFATASSHAQWQAQPGVPNVDYYSIQLYNDQIINGGGHLASLRSNDNGSTWDTTYVTVFGEPFPCTFYDVHFITPQTGVASGVMSLGSQYVMLRTTNSGQSWTPTYVSQTGGLLRWIRDIEFGTAMEGFAVGSDDRLLRTTDGGLSWTQLDPPGSGHLNAFQYGSGNVRHIVGNGRILRSTDGGATWTAQSFPGHDLRGLHFPSSLRGFAVGEQGSLLRTDDGGLTWTVMNGPFGGVDLTGVHFTSDNEGYVTGGTRIWRTTTGGLYWEWFECGTILNAITFSGTVGFAVGEGGAIYRSNGGTGGYHPIARFEISPSPYCADSLITLTSLSDPLLTTTWLYNGEFLANTTNTSLVISAPQQTDTISMVVNNGFHSDTVTVLITIAPSLNIAAVASLVQDTLCAGGSTQVQVPTSIPGVSYQLRRGLTTIGNAQFGNGNTLTFNTGTINGQDTLNILATRSVPGCGTGRDSTFLVIHNATPLTTLNVTALDAVVCEGGTTDILVPGAEPGVSYQLRIGAMDVGAPQIGTGGDLLFNSGPMDLSSVFTIQATHPFGCSATLAPSIVVTVVKPEALFTVPSYNPMVGITWQVINSSNVAGASYAWSFGPDAIPASSSALAPSVSFTTPGTASITLTLTSPEGCVDQAETSIQVIPGFVPDACIGVQGHQVGGSGSFLCGVAYGPSHELVSLVSTEGGSPVKFFGTHQDSVTSYPTYSSSGYNRYNHLLKVDSAGVPQWMVRISMEESWGGDGDVCIDEAGNIYAVVFIGAASLSSDSVRVHSSDGSSIEFRASPGPNSTRRVMVASWDGNGLFRWYDTFLTHYGAWAFRIAASDDGLIRVLVGGSGSVNPYLSAYDSNSGDLVWAIQASNYDVSSDMVVDPGGHAFLTRGVNIDRYAPDGTLISTMTIAENIPVGGINAQFSLQEIVMDPAGDLYVTGNFKGRWVVGSDTLENLVTTWYSNDHIICRIDTATGPTWARRIKVTANGVRSHDGFTVAGDHVLWQSGGIAGTFSIEGYPPLVSPVVCQVFVHFDTNGGTPRLWEFPEGIGNFGALSSGRWKHSLTRSWDEQRITSVSRFTDTLQVNGVSYTPYASSTIVGNYLITLGDVDCYVPGLPSPTATPISYFSVPQTPSCLWDMVTFTDASLNDATSWDWTFEGGLPATSNAANPSVVFTTPGEHLVTLTTANSNGTGTTWSSSIYIDICTGMSAPSTTAYSLAPTLTSDLVILRSPEGTHGEFTIVDGLGRTVATGRLEPQLQLDVRSWSPGIYTVHAPHGMIGRFCVTR